MHTSTASVLLRHLAQQKLLTTRMTTFSVPRIPMVVHPYDIREAFIALADSVGFGATSFQVTYNHGIEIYCREKLFERLFRAIFIVEKNFPVETTAVGDGGAPLPTLFIGSEKTQIRQIPLATERPWPFRFLMELGGMIVCKAEDEMDFALELRQYLNNFPQYEVKVKAKRWPTGEIAVFTWWFRELPRNERKSNVNVT